MHIELVLLILLILCMISKSQITTSCIGLVPDNAWVNRPTANFTPPSRGATCLPLCNPSATPAITNNCYPICNPSASPPITINCRPTCDALITTNCLQLCSSLITTDCLCNGENNPDGCYTRTLTMPSSCNPSDCVNAAEYQYDTYRVIISGLIRYEPGHNWMGSSGNGLIATFGNQEQCPSNPEIFTATNGFGLDC
eukprot:393759_1